MHVHWAYDGLSKQDEEEIQRSWEHEQRHLRSRLETLSDEPIELELVVYRQAESPQWQIQSALHMLDLETKKAEFDRMLVRLTREQRQAIVLNTVYGYSLAEVADFLDRPEDLVRTDIDNGRRLLEQYFRDQYLSDLEEQLETDAN